MVVKAGVWIDHEQAVLVLVGAEGQEIKKVASGVEGPGRTRPDHDYTPTDVVPEGRLERKLDARLDRFYDEVIGLFAGAESLLILGPGEAKGEFRKRVEGKHLKGLAVAVESADKMTDGQVAAKVLLHFRPIPS